MSGSEVPCPMFGSANSNIDIANDYLFALFLGESIASHCDNINCKETRRSISFKFNPKSANTLADLLFQFCQAFNDEWEIDFENSIMEFSFNLDKQVRFFPALADAYTANIVAGQEDIYDSDLDQDALQSLYASHPEREFGFWRSFISQELGHDLYVSPWAWIILNDPDSEEALRDVTLSLERYGGFEKGIPLLLDAFYLSMNDLPSVVFNDFRMMHFPLAGIKKAQACAAAIWDKIFRENDLTVKFDNVSKIFRAVHTGFNDKTKLRLSENGYLLVASDAMAQYIFFKESTPLKFIESHFTKDTEWRLETVPTMWEIPQKFQVEYWNAIDKLSETLGTLSGNPVDIALDWDQLNDETFEQLCYDILGQVAMSLS